MRKPVLGNIKNNQAGRVARPTTVAKRNWTFSLQYWKQISKFGLGQSNASWFVSLLEKLSDLSKKDPDIFLSDRGEKNAWRYHGINWQQQNIPIQRSDLDWIPKIYLLNDEEYPLVQFQISKALGRVVGFMDEKQVFNIVLLDPLHNLQPSQHFHYRVDDCEPLTCEYSKLVANIDEIKNNSNCADSSCGYKGSLDNMPTYTLRNNVIMHYIDQAQTEDLSLILKENKAKSASEVFGMGLLTYMDDESV